MIEHRFCYLFEVRPESIDEYERAHHDIPPRVPAAMRRAGVREYSLFRREMLVVAVGVSDRPVEEVMRILDGDLDNREWSRRIRTLMPAPLEPDGRLRFAPEVWRMPSGPDHHEKEGSA